MDDVRRKDILFTLVNVKQAISHLFCKMQRCLKGKLRNNTTLGMTWQLLLYCHKIS